MPPRSRPRRTVPPQLRGSAGQAGTSMQAVCRPCCARVSPTRGCADGAASPHPGFGVITLPWACCPPPRNGSTNPPTLFLELLAGQAPCPASSPPAGSLPAPCHLLLGPLTRTTSLGAPTGCSDALGCCGQGLGRAPPHLYLLQRETIYREIYIFKLIFKDLFLSLRPRPAAQCRQRGGTPFASAAGAQSRGTDLVHAPQFHGVLGGHR